MEQFNKTVQLTQNVWMIQKCDSDEPSEAFKKAAYLLRGVVKAGIINCLDTRNCNDGGDGKIVFIHSEGVDNTFEHDQLYNLIVVRAMGYIQKNQTIENYHLANVQIVEFSSEKI